MRDFVGYEYPQDWLTWAERAYRRLFPKLWGDENEADEDFDEFEVKKEFFDRCRGRRSADDSKSSLKALKIRHLRRERKLRRTVKLEDLLGSDTDEEILEAHAEFE
jgi:hypothetical protein